MKKHHYFISSSLFLLAMAAPLVAQDGLYDLVKPDLDKMRKAADEERKKQQAEKERLRQEEDAKRLEEEERQKAIEKAKADPLIDVESLKLIEDEAGAKQEYKIEPGGTLGAISAERYGSSWYYPLIEFWNDCKATKVYVGQVVKTPSIATIAKVKGSAVLARYPEEMVAMLQLREDFLALEPVLRAEAEAGEMTDETKSKVKEMLASSKKIHAGFLVKRPGVKEYATGLLAQCRSVSDQLDALAQGDFGKEGSRITRVHTHLGQAMRNAIVWGTEGFK